MAHPILGTWTSPPYRINLRQGGGGLSAEVIHEQGSVIHFISSQIKCGIMGTLSQESLIEKISKIAQEKLKEHMAVFAFPKEQPTELWIFEATPMAGLQIRQGKEHLQQTQNPETSLAFYEKALKNFETALKFQKTFKGNTQELELGIVQIKKEILLLKCRQNSILYLPNEKEVKEFQAVIAIYKDQENFLECFEAHLSVQESLSPHHHLMFAMIHEDKRELLKAVEAYLSLSQDNPQQIACIEKAYALFEEIKDGDEDQGISQVGVQGGDDHPAVVNTNLHPPQWTNQRQPNVSSSGSSEMLGERSLQKDSIRMAFEKYLASFSQQSSQQQAPTCFICFNVDEKDVGKWLEEILVPDLDTAGIKPIFCFRELSQRQDLDNFQELARSADLVIIACTPELKAKYEERKKAPVGLAQEIRMIKVRYNDEKKANTIFPIYLKGTRKEALPTAYFEPIFGAKFAPFSEKAISLEFNYFSNAFDLFTALRGLSRESSRRTRELFFEDMKKILRGEIDREKVEAWRSQRKKKLGLIRDSISERVSVNTQMVNLPLPPQDFTGREKELKELHNQCSHQHRVAVTGMGGVGKTTLALKYANDYKSYYQFIHFMPAGSSQLMIDGLLKLADDLHLPKSDKAEERLGWLKTTLEKFEKEYLLIFDGMDQIETFQEIEKYLPARGRCLLLTSRMPQQAKAQNFEVVELHLFSFEEAIDYLLKATGLKKSKEAQELAELLGRLPLALKHVVGYIRSRKITIQDYIQKFQNYKVELFEDKYLTLTKEEKTILKTWNVSIEAIEKDHNCALAKEILEFFAFLGEAPIPDSLVKEWGKQVHPDTSELNLENAIRYLCDYSMISSSQPHSYEVHSLVQLVALYQMVDERQKQIFKEILPLMTSRMERFDVDNIETWSAAKLDLPHAKFLFANKKLIHDIDLYRIFKFMIALIDFYRIWEKPNLTLELCQKTLSVAEKLNRDDFTFISQNKLGTAFEILGQSNKALEAYQKSLAIGIKIYGKNNSNIAQAYNNVGCIFQAIGKADEALSKFKKALKINIATFGEKNALVATNYNNMGVAFKDLGKNQDALDSFNKALKIRLDLYGTNHPDIVVNYNNIGAVLQISEMNVEALDYFQKALMMGLSIYGENYPTVIKSYNNIGTALRNLKRFEEALKAHEKALEIKLRIYGENHPDIGTSYNNIGIVLRDLKRFDEALRTYQIALKIKCVSGESHIDVVKNYINIGDVFRDMGKINEALKNYNKSLTTLVAIYKKNNFNSFFSNIYNKIGLALQDLKRPIEALNNYQKALSISLAVNGENHPFTAAIYNNIGAVIGYLKGPSAALYFQQKAFKIGFAIYGENHLDIACSYNNIAMSYVTLGNFIKALNYAQKALKIRTTLLGENHPLVKQTREGIEGIQQIALLLDDEFEVKRIQENTEPNDSDDFPSEILTNIETKTTPEEALLKNRTSASSVTDLLPQDRPFQNFDWNQLTVATLLWKNPQALIADDMVEKVKQVALYLHSKGFELGGVLADGNCFLTAFLENYRTLSRKIPILDEQSNPIAYLRTCIAAEYPQDSAQNRERADQIKKDGQWITAQGEGDLLAKALFVPIRIVTVHQDSSGWGISDMLTDSGKDLLRKEWKTISERDRPQEYVFIVDLGGHFLYAKKRA